MNRRHWPWLLLLVAVIGLIFSKTLVHWLTESWWFNAVGFAQVFWTRLGWQFLLGLFTFGAYALFLWGNYQIALRQTRGQTVSLRQGRLLEGSQFQLSQVILKSGIILLILITALFAALASTSAWDTVLTFLNASRFGETEPIFQQDIGFYVFALPFYEAVRNWLMALLILGLGLSTLIYSFNEAVAFAHDRTLRIPKGVKAHLQLLVAGITGLGAWSFWLGRYDLLYSTEGAVFGAGYTDVHARLFGYQVLSLATLAIAALLVVFAWRKKLMLLWWGAGLLGLGMLLLLGVFPWMQQQFFVRPNELAQEVPYLAHNIRFTQRAYGLQNVQKQNFAAESQITSPALQQNQPTVANIRLWDYRPLLSTYRQLQEIRLYYHFHDVDVDRYQLQGNYQQVMLSAREIAIDQLPIEARTWVNQHLKYTHGYGVVMSPVNRANPNGLPELFLRDIPPKTSVDLPVSQAAIYYGEATNPYIFTNTSTPEFDYPKGNTNALTTYSGKGGVPLPSIWHRLAYAYDLNSLETLISNYFTPQSRIHYYRSIQSRIRHVAPFLRFDSDPYITIINGRLQWIVDAYTVSNRYPYSQPVGLSNDAAAVLRSPGVQEIIAGDVNYIRNSVKVLIDAYDGTLRFFAIDPTYPVLQTYQRIFPKLFELADSMPPEVHRHFRYPLDLFKLQSQMYLTYHMNDPEVFYNREDLWRFPIENFEGNQAPMQPYYVIMRLPGEANPSFMLILPFTPSQKDNMVAWLAANSNGSFVGQQDYGKLLLYEFPKQKLVFGPRQIEARIDQEPQISQQFTLWSQAGSKLIRGNLLVVPIDQSLLYVEPVYLRAEQGELPELKRVIVADGENVAMAENLENALAIMLGNGPTPASTPATPSVRGNLVQQALATFQKAQTALKQGNWADYGRYQQELEQLLQRLNQQN
jgi:uncharacterized protein